MADKIRDIIYRKALGILNIDYDLIKQKEASTPVEIKYCNENIETACCTAMSSGEFFWLISSTTFSSRAKNSDDSYKSYHGFKYGYSCPSDLYRPFLVEGEYNSGFARKGKEIYFEIENPTLDYMVDITQELDNESWDYPAPFLDLISCLLAINIAPMVAPEGTFGQNAATKMQTALAACNTLQKDANRARRQSPKEYLQ